MVHIRKKGRKMIPKDALSAKRSGEHIVLEGRDGNIFYVLGSTMKTSIDSGHRFPVSFAMIQPEPEGEPGLIAVHVIFKESKKIFDQYWFLRINPKNEKPVDLVSPWHSSEAVVQLDIHGIHVLIGGITYTSNLEQVGPNSINKLYVPDPDLLCKYVFSKASAEDVEEAARDHIVKKNPTSLNIMLLEALQALARKTSDPEKKEKEAINLMIQEMERTIEDLKFNYAVSQKTIARLTGELERVSDERTEYLGKYVDMANAQHKQEEAVSSLKEKLELLTKDNDSVTIMGGKALMYAAALTSAVKSPVEVRDKNIEAVLKKMPAEVEVFVSSDLVFFKFPV